MARWVCLVTGLVAWTGAGAAAAQEVQPAGGYPQELVERPLILPAGTVAVDAQARTLLYNQGGGDGDPLLDFIYTDATVRAGLGAAEIYAGIALLVDSPDFAGSPDTLDTILGGVLVGVAPELALTAEVSILQPLNDSYKGVSVRLGVTAKRRLNPRAAMIAAGGLLVSNGYPETGDDTRLTWLVGDLRLQAQASPGAAVEATAGLWVPVENNLPGEATVASQTSFGLRGLVHADGRVDVFAGLAIAPFAGVAPKTVTLGVEGRLP